jgi:hypothetical protein
MPANPASMVQSRPHEFQHLLTSVTGPDARSQTASPVELPLFRRLLALGAALWRLCLVTRAVVRPAAPVPAPDGTRLTGHDQRPTIDDAVFGNGSCARHAFTAPGQSGSCALDAELSLPAHGYADLLREWAVSGTPDESSRERQTVRDRILGRSRRVQARETCAAEAGAEVTPVDEQPAEPMAEAPLGTILVVPADGTGGPMVPPPTQRLPVRLGQGQQRGQKQAAVVTGLSTMAPYPRTPQEVVAALLQEPGGPEPAGRPRPEGKELRATRGASGRDESAGAAGGPARGAPDPAARGPHRGRRGAATASGAPWSGAHPGARYHPRHGVSVGHGHRPAGGDPSAAPGLGTRLLGAAAGRTDRRRHHSVGGRREGPHLDGDATARGAADGGLLPPAPAR